MRRISPSMGVALLALFIALGGSTFAATHYRITSSKQIKPSVIRYLKGHNGYGSSVAQCPPGTTLTGGGAFVGPSGPSGGRAAVIKQSAPGDEQGQWVATAVNPGPDQYGVYPSGAAVVWAYALCASP
jgi:hypothetical protein